MLYRVRPGCTFGHSNQHTEGAIVELAEHEAAPFLDKLEPVAVEPSLDTGDRDRSQSSDVTGDASSDETVQAKPRDRRRRTGEPDA